MKINGNFSLPQQQGKLVKQPIIHWLAINVLGEATSLVLLISLSNFVRVACTLYPSTHLLSLWCCKTLNFMLKLWTSWCIKTTINTTLTSKEQKCQALYEEDSDNIFFFVRKVLEECVIIWFGRDSGCWILLVDPPWRFSPIYSLHHISIFNPALLHYKYLIL